MDLTETDKLVKQLAAGFEVLQDEYQKLHGQHLALERKLATAREQYNELAKLCGSGALRTPPLSLSSSSPRPGQETEYDSIADVLEHSAVSDSKEIAHKVREAIKAAKSLQEGLPRLSNTIDGVRIWSGPSADRPMSDDKIMPSISESPLEQDFTVEGKPSKLGCPFASMVNKKLSSHAASVLGRYNTGSNGPATNTAVSSVSRINARESLSKKDERRLSFVDPIKAEICGLSDHDDTSPYSERAAKELHHSKPDDNNNNADVGVCPIRFLDQHSPEEVATYFERHKHELPRSHETCVKRYQSNEQQIRELDAKYGTLVSMIQGLGAKHKDFLPKEPPDEGGEEGNEDAKGDEKVRKWAKSVSAQPAAGDEAVFDKEEEDEEDRQPRFERPLRDIRVGESPSRPWGISVPRKYLDRRASGTRSKSPGLTPLVDGAAHQQHQSRMQDSAGCPFHFDKNPAAVAAATSGTAEKKTPEPQIAKTNPVFLADAAATAPAAADEPSGKSERIILTGPVFIGYSAEDAAKILQAGGFGRPSAEGVRLG